MLSNYEGDRVPQVTFRMFSGANWYDLSTADLFRSKTVVMFAVPGAFACPHSPIQLLLYNEYAETLWANGVDDIICISVNDPFSLERWAQDEGADRLHFVPDVNGQFTREMGMIVDLSSKGMGQRSRRYSMLVKDGIIEKIFIEQGGFETMPVVSDAETMLNYINPMAERPQRTTVLRQLWRVMLSA